MRCVDFLAGLELDRADGQRVPGALVEQAHQFLVDAVDGLAMFLEAHGRLFVVLLLLRIFIVRVIVVISVLFVEGELFL